MRIVTKDSIKEAQDNSCGTCTFFGKLALCPRRERYAGAIPCRKYEGKIEATSPIFPLLPDTGAGKSKEEIEEAFESPSLMWYLVPFFFGLLGGIVGYVAVKDSDKNMANNLLIFGTLWSIFLFIIGYAIIFH